MIVGAPGHHGVAALHETLCHGPGVVQHTLLIDFEIRPHGFLERHRLGGDDVHQWPALHAGKDRGRKTFSNLGVLPRKNQAAAGTAQRLVGCGGHHIGDGCRIGVQAGDDQTRDMSHVGQQKSPDGIRNLAKAFEVENP